MRYIQKCFVLTTCIALQACTSPLPAPVKVDPAGVAVDNVLRLKAVNKAIGPETPIGVPVYGPKTTVSFLGDASTLLSNAVRGIGSGWSYEAVGPQPHLPIYVQVHVEGVSFSAFLQNIAEQLGQRADIELNGKAIKLRYRANN